MPHEVREMYQRAREKVDEKPVQSSPVDELPRTEDLYRRSAPENMQDKPSDEVIYQPSPPLIEPAPPIIEPDQTLGSLAIGLAVAVLLAGIVLFIFFGG